MFNNNNNTQAPRKRLNQMSEEEQKQLAIQYASADWHNVENALKHAGIEVDLGKVKVGLVKYKLANIQGKAERSFGIDINDI